MFFVQNKPSSFFVWQRNGTHSTALGEHLSKILNVSKFVSVVVKNGESKVEEKQKRTKFQILTNILENLQLPMDFQYLPNFGRLVHHD